MIAIYVIDEVCRRNDEGEEGGGQLSILDSRARKDRGVVSR